MKRTDVDVAVIGGGAAGLVAATACATLGARTALVERHRLGGECTWTGCVPSKTLLHLASQAAAIRQAPPGIRVDGLEIDFPEIMASVRATRERIYRQNESPAYLKLLGIRPLQATARFLEPRTLRIERDGRSRELTFRSAIVATGSRPLIPDIAGLDEVDYLTTDTAFEIDELPERLAILGGGSTGVELAQTFARLGSHVTIITRNVRLIPEMDHDASALLLDALNVDGVTAHFRSTISMLRQTSGRIEISIAGGEARSTLTADRLLVATGRRANTEGLGLETVGVSYDVDGIHVDEYCRTTVRHILATGDVTPVSRLTHAGENMSKAAAVNALTRLPLRKHDTDVIPYVIYTDPEVAAVGKSQRALDAEGASYDVIELPYEKIDRALIEDRATGFVRVYHRRGRVLGATIAGAQAGEMIAVYALAMQHGISLPALSESVLAYPTMMLGARRAADQFLVRALKPWMVRGFRLLYGYRGEIPAHVGSRTVV